MTERSIFLTALDLDDPAARAYYLDHACEGDPGLRGRVEALLAAHADSKSFMGRPAPDLAPPGDTTAPHGATPAAGDLAGTVLAGRYELVRELGSGGMGTVYLAEQLRPVRRRVAVKLVRAGMDTRAVLARFDAERQALAVMDHPHIAKVLDAGETDRGRPFFVMEVVDGLPLTDYCDAHALPVAARLALFRAVCQAVQHAHQKGVIHRDLKPSNVLVEARDGAAVPKVIDFGLAKAFGAAALAEHSLLTAPGAVAGTPLYMAPEQAGPAGHDVDTRADVYALGAILYELLTGTTPLSRDTLRRAALDEVLRAVREQDPPTPSSRLAAAGSTPSAAANRSIEPGRLGRLVKGDLDWVVMKALEKDRGRRYESAAAFAADVDRFLAHEPVAAGPPSRRYKARKFARRNRVAVAAASVLLAVLIAGAVGTTAGLLRAVKAEAAAIRRERAEAKARRHAEAVATFMREVFALGSAEGQADRGREATRDVTVRQAMDFAVKQLAGRFDGEPAVEAAVRHTIGVAYRELGAYPEAGAQLRRALELNEAALGPDDPDTLACVSQLALVHLDRGEFAAAEPLMRRCQAAHEAAHGPDHPETLNAVHCLATLSHARGDQAAAESLFQQSLSGREQALGPDHPDTLHSAAGLAAVYDDRGDREKCEPLKRRVAAGRQKVYGPDHPLTLQAESNLALTYYRYGDLDAAEPIMKRVLESWERTLGPDHPHTGTGLNNLALVYSKRGDLDRAEGHYRRAVAVLEKALKPDHPHTLQTLSALNQVFVDRGDLAAAESGCQRVLTAWLRSVGPDHLGTFHSLAELAMTHWKMGRPERGIPLLEEAARGYVAHLGADNPEALRNLANLAVLYKDAGRVAEAVPMLERVYKGHAKHPDLDWVGDQLANAYRDAGRPADAARLAVERFAAMRSTLKPDDPQLGLRLAYVGSLMLPVDPAAAEPLLRESVAVREKLDPADWNTALSKLLLGTALLRLKKYGEAESLLLAGYAGLSAEPQSVPPASPWRSVAADRLLALYLATKNPAAAAKWRAERALYPPEVAPPPRPSNR